MELVTIGNERLTVKINPQGAELTSLVNNNNGQEYMWGAGPAWPKRSPILFPIVGTLKENCYYFKGTRYELGRHGFARDRRFEVEEQTENEVVFLLKSDEESLAVYPFEFNLRVRYTVQNDTLSVSYEVLNTGEEEMYFSVGGHPAFSVPLKEDEEYDDYYLQFEKAETVGRWPISADGLIEEFTMPLLEDSRELPLNKELFARDAIVLKELQSQSVKLLSRQSAAGFTFNFSGFPYLGIWAAKGADFVCIEPWCGIADNVNADQQLPHKEGINSLFPGDVFRRTWTVEF
ncbi:aldose 1-epimerase family protein [Nostoc ellipsosporum NOK]|nr:aldose 1-epimerase family protein [Nostoc ellipsosporum NOK]